MALFGGNFNRKPRQFEYRPIYYDPEKEERERRRRLMKLRQEMEQAEGVDSEVEYEEEPVRPGDIIRRRMGADREFRAEMERQRKHRNVRTIVMIIVLTCAMIWILNSVM